jgi:hypothetical protein
LDVCDNPFVQAQTEAVSPVREAFYSKWLERNLVPDWAIRIGIRRLLAERLRELEAGGPDAQATRKAQFVEQMSRGPIAVHTAAANAQHYEVPSEFYRLVLGPHLKYSSAFYAPGVETLEEPASAPNSPTASACSSSAAGGVRCRYLWQSDSQIAESLPFRIRGHKKN